MLCFSHRICVVTPARSLGRHPFSVADTFLHPQTTAASGNRSVLEQSTDTAQLFLAIPSVDDVDSHKRWISDIEDTQSTKVAYPIIADPKGEVAELYGTQSEIEESRDLFPHIRSFLFMSLLMLYHIYLTHRCVSDRYACSQCSRHCSRKADRSLRLRC